MGSEGSEGSMGFPFGEMVFPFFNIRRFSPLRMTKCAAPRLSNLLNLSYNESVGLKNKQIEVNYTRKGL
jgi:hypothetical protein